MKVIAGAIVNPIAFGHIEYNQHSLLVISDENIISRVEKFASLSELELVVNEFKNRNIDIKMLNKDQFMCPGFVDLHAHAPQIRNLGLGLDYPLLEWLDKITFPEEVSYSQGTDEPLETYEQRIRAIYEPMVKAMIANGTLTCCFFGSLQLQANKILVQVLKEQSRLRSYVGKVCMDCFSPDNYMEGASESVQGTEQFIKMVQNYDQDQGQLYPVVTPRFALCCSSESMHNLAKLAKKLDTHIQTHMSENLNEIQRARELFPDCQSYTEIYDQHNLLGSKTILAHCIHLSDEEIVKLAQRQVGIAHCPNSNFALNSGILNVRRLIAGGIRVGLGTDISGGYEISILDAMRQAIIASKAVYFTDPQYKPLTVEEVFTLATVCGAQALSIADQTGSIKVGNRADLLIIDISACQTPRKSNETLIDKLSRFVFLGDDRWLQLL